MTWYPDMGNETMICRGPFVRAVGWLHADHPFAKGSVPPEAITRMKKFVQLADESTMALEWPIFMGVHICELCEDTHGVKNFGVPTELQLFVAPEMIVHYIEEHSYAPPEEFIEALMSSPLPGTEAYRVAVANFWSSASDGWTPLF